MFTIKYLPATAQWAILHNGNNVVRICQDREQAEQTLDDWQNNPPTIEEPYQQGETLSFTYKDKLRTGNFLEINRYGNVVCVFTDENGDEFIRSFKPDLMGEVKRLSKVTA